MHDIKFIRNNPEKFEGGDNSWVQMPNIPHLTQIQYFHFHNDIHTMDERHMDHELP